jgi:hypothetical protein
VFLEAYFIISLLVKPAEFKGLSLFQVSYLFQALNTNTKQKVLKIAPTEGMKIDKDGILLWVPPDEEF